MRCLITGVGGFAASHLADHLIGRGDEVVGTYWPEEARPHAGGSVVFPAFPLDITRGEDVRRRIGESRPEAIFHLAGVSNVKVAWGSIQETLEINIVGAFHVLDAAASLGPEKVRVLLVGSAEQYGPVPPERQPISETHELDPRNPYGASKAAQEILGRMYHRSHGLPVFLVRAFNHIGPRQAPFFVASSFARQIAEIEAGLRKNPLLVGNIESRRDFTDVRDVVRAYASIVDRGEPGDVYNVCSGTPVRIAEILDSFIAEARCPIQIQTDPQLYRPVDMPVYCGDASKIRSKCGWQPEIPLRRTLLDLLEYWRGSIQSGHA